MPHELLDISNLSQAQREKALSLQKTCASLNHVLRQGWNPERYGVIQKDDGSLTTGITAFATPGGIVPAALGETAYQKAMQSTSTTDQSGIAHPADKGSILGEQGYHSIDKGPKPPIGGHG